MKTAYLLFGLASAACASTPTPQYPLCDHAGAPACGNIGQVGRSDQTPVRIAALATRDAGTHVVPTPVVDASAVHARPTLTRALAPTGRASAAHSQVRTARLAAVPTRVLLGASVQEQHVTVLGRPLVDHREDFLAGNVMSKGGPRHVHRSPDGAAAAETADDIATSLTTP